MDNVKRILIKTVKDPMISIMKIIKSKDNDTAKLKAISLYCTCVLTAVNKTILRDNEI